MPGAGPFDSLTKSARSLTVSGIDAKNDRKNAALICGRSKIQPEEGGISTLSLTQSSLNFFHFSNEYCNILTFHQKIINIILQYFG